ncbi:MAG: MraY family glycosyltransferase [Bacillota bacterium]|nr:MraY family glycosyltransferase [Bacillota bacterium]HHU61553.1 undecaprenyl/decaprenyl-phosphate alpha-N-acetylglucosaminyl 1-phosphate transferase [Natronincola sp.]
MMNFTQFIMALIISTTITSALTPMARRFALRMGLVDVPNPRRINKVPMPTGGGMAIFVGFFAASLVGEIPHVSVTLLAAFLILLLGLIDDRFELSPGLKFAGQVFAVTVYVIWGPRIEFISNPLGGMLFLGKLSIPLTMLWVLTLINVMNFIDGLDGLTVGISMISAVALTTLALMLGRYDAALLAVILVGVTLGFFPYNFNPARVYLGDGGAMLLGFLLAAVSTEGALKGAATISISVPILILAVPLVDLLCAVIRRMQKGVPIYEADQGHFHHRLLKLGYTQRQAVCVAYLITGFTASMAVLTAHLTKITWFVVLVLGLVFWYGSIRVGMINSLREQYKERSRDA